MMIPRLVYWTLFYLSILGLSYFLHLFRGNRYIRDIYWLRWLCIMKKRGNYNNAFVQILDFLLFVEPL